MNLGEDAAISYQPDDDEQAARDGIHVALAEAERQLTHRQGFEGIGIAKSPVGEDVIVVYVEDQQALSQLPAAVGGFAVVGEISGEIRAL
jgi:hypothetical protein